MDREGFKFNLITQRFIVNRWGSELGEQVSEEVREGLKQSVDVRFILDQYILDHPSNIEPYGYPYFPEEAMEKEAFWVLTNTDLRGVHFYNEDFPSSPSFTKKQFSYASFYNCNLSEVNLEGTDFSYAQFKKCNLFRTIFAGSGGFSTRFIDCDMREACLWQGSFIDSEFLGCNMGGVYFEDAFLKDITVNHLSKFDTSLASRWNTRIMPPEQRPDILRAIRIGYQKAEVWDEADRFLYAERTEKRKYVLWPSLKVNCGRSELLSWAWDIISWAVSGYGTKSLRVIGWAFLVSVLYALLYLLAGPPEGDSSFIAAVLGTLYFSFTTFATLGYGDVSYSLDHPYLRLLSTSEAWLGAIFIAILVVVLGKKIFR